MIEKIVEWLNNLQARVDRLEANDGSVYSSAAYIDGSTTITGGLNVGTSSGATAGQVRASGTATISGGLNVGAATTASGGFIIMRNNATNGPQMGFQNTTTSAPDWRIGIPGSANSEDLFIFDNSSGGAGTVMFLKRDGSVGIGRSDPAYRVDASGSIRATTSVIIGGDIGSGVASHTIITNGNNVAANSTGTGTIKLKGATNRDSTGFIKIYVGTTAYWVPFFTTITG